MGMNLINAAYLLCRNSNLKRYKLLKAVSMDFIQALTSDVRKNRANLSKVLQKLSENLKLKRPDIVISEVTPEEKIKAIDSNKKYEDSRQ